jgi:pimeloyl-ACP methyl ester carboxylesterase
MTRYHLLLICCLWVLLIAPITTTHATSSPFATTECTQDAPTERTVECGTMTLPLYADGSKPGTVELPIMIVRSTTPTKNLPLFLLQGGPGGDTIETFQFLVKKPHSTLPTDRDLVFFEQRGTTNAKPSLDCPEIYDQMITLLAKKVSSAEQLQYNKTAWQACRDRLGKAGIDVGAFNSQQNADDIAAIAVALNYPQIDLYGVSYGTLLAQHVVRRHPTLVRALILDSVVPMHQNVNLWYRNSGDQAIRNGFADCAADIACARDYPDIQNEYIALVNKLNAQPLMLDLHDHVSGNTYPSLIDGDSLAGFVFQMHYDEELVTYIPMLIHQISRGNYDTFTTLAGFFVFEDSMSEGMQASTICSEEVLSQTSDYQLPNPSLLPIDPDDLTYDVADERQWCAIAAVPQLDASVNQPFQSDVPTLVYSGRYDPITPAQFGDAVLPGLPNSRHVVFARTAHGSFVSNACAGQIAVAFLDKPQRNWTELTAICDINQKATFATSQTLRQGSFISQIMQLSPVVMPWLYLIIAVSCLFSSVFVIRPLKMLYKTVRGIYTPPMVQQLHWAELIASISALGVVSYLAYIAVDSSLNMDGYGIMFGIPTVYNALPVLLYSLPLSIFVLWYTAYRIYAAPSTKPEEIPSQPTAYANWLTYVYAGIILLSSVVLLVTLLFNGIYGG